MKTLRNIFIVLVLCGGIMLLSSLSAAEDNAGRMPALPGMVGKT